MLIIYFREEQGRLRRDGVWGTQLEISGGRRPSGNIEDIAEPEVLVLGWMLFVVSGT